MIGRKLVLAALIAAPLLVAQTAHAQVFDLRIGTPPPPPRVVEVPAARPGYVWAPGYWNWEGRRHVWHDGNWIRERRGYHYVAPAWEPVGHEYGFHRGHWERG
jgi:hypothetical protein